MAACCPLLGTAKQPLYFALLDGWKTSLTGLTPVESQAMFLSWLVGPAAQLGLGDAVKAAQLKLLVSLPASWREQAQTVSKRLHLDPIDWYREQEPVPHLSLVAEAVWTNRQLAIRYESWKLYRNSPCNVALSLRPSLRKYSR
jgi:predicted DNA-binding transcriptional regulator YafY